jgi:hypothetical protein
MRDDDIFRKLNKETPLVKRKDLQPLARQDFAPRRSAFDMMMEKTNDKRAERKSGGSFKSASGNTKSARGGNSNEQEAEKASLLLYNEAPGEDGQRIQRPQPRVIQARSETRVRTSPEPLKRPEVRTVSAGPRGEQPVVSGRVQRPESRPVQPVNPLQKEPAPQRAAEPERHATPQKPTARPRQPEPENAPLQIPKAETEYRPKQIDLQQEKAQYFPAREKRSGQDAAELEIFDETELKVSKPPRVMAPMRMQRTELDEYFEPEQDKDAQPAFRHELKYYINYREYILLRNTLKALAQLDRYATESGDYMIRSLYFDDEYESALKEKLGGSDHRKKYRIRIYNLSDDTIKFEKKMKEGQFIAKKSIALSRGEYDSIIAGDYAFLLRRKEPLAQELYLELTNNRLRPRVVVDYSVRHMCNPLENGAQPRSISDGLHSVYWLIQHPI